MQTASDDIRIGFDEQRKRLCTGRGSQFDFDEAIAALLLLAAQLNEGPSSFSTGALATRYFRVLPRMNAGSACC